MDATQIIPPRDRCTRDTNRLQQLLHVPTYHSRLEFVIDASTVKVFRAAIVCYSSDPKCSFKGCIPELFEIHGLLAFSKLYL